MFEEFLGKRFIGEKRFSLEGGEGAIVLLDAIVKRCPAAGVSHIEMGMAHRGRLNVLANILHKPLKTIFREFTPDYLPESPIGRSDVKYHLGYATTRHVDGRDLHVRLSSNPSHLEAVYPVVEGRARAMQHNLEDAERKHVLPLVLHGDAAFAGQGLVAEVLNLSLLKGYRTGGTVHLIINNVGGSRPGITDMSTLGQPGDFAMFLAENADASPWPPFHTEYGFLPERNVVTVAAVEGYSGIMGIGYSRPEYLDLIAAWLRGHDRPYRWSIILLVAQDTAQMLAREGWTREAMRQYIRERARIPFGEWNRQYHGAKEARKGVPEEVFAIADPNELVDKPFFDSMPVIVAGGTGEKSMLLPCWASGKMVSQEIRLPASWGEGVR